MPQRNIEREAQNLVWERGNVLVAEIGCACASTYVCPNPRSSLSSCSLVGKAKSGSLNLPLSVQSRWFRHRPCPYCQWYAERLLAFGWQYAAKVIHQTKTATLDNLKKKWCTTAIIGLCVIGTATSDCWLQFDVCSNRKESNWIVKRTRFCRRGKETVRKD